MPTITWEKTQLEDVKSLVVCVVGTLLVHTLTVEKTLVLTYGNTIAGQCRTNPWPAVPDWTLMPECRCRTEAADYRKKCRCRTNFFPAFRHSVIYLWQKMSPGFPHHLIVQQEAPQWVAVNRIDKGGFFQLFLFMYIIQDCVICRPSDSTVSEDAGIEPRTVATLALTARCSNHLAKYM